MAALPAGVTIVGPPVPGADAVLTPDALAVVADLQRRFGSRRDELLAARAERQRAIAAGADPAFLAGTQAIRSFDWRVAGAPADLDDRRVEITGPAESKMMINALNSGARVFMADLEDALSPTWANLVAGQAALRDAVRRTLALSTPEKAYRLAERTATLVVRPRGWHLEERHVLVDGRPVSASLFDFGLYVAHNGAEALARGSGPYLYLAKLESHHEARLWNDVFIARSSRPSGSPHGSIRATVLIETILAAFEMDEILYELREHAAGPQRRPLGLHLQHHQEVPRAARVRAAGPRPGDDGRAVHARLHPAARPDLPSPWRPRDRRDVGLHPEPPRAGGDRQRARPGP